MTPWILPLFRKGVKESHVVGDATLSIIRILRDPKKVLVGVRLVFNFVKALKNNLKSNSNSIFRFLFLPFGMFFGFCGEVIIILRLIWLSL